MVKSLLTSMKVFINFARNIITDWFKHGGIIKNQSTITGFPLLTILLADYGFENVVRRDSSVFTLRLQHMDG